MFGLHQVSYNNIDSGLQGLSFDLPHTAAPFPHISGAPIEYMRTINGYICTNSEENSGYLVPMCIDPAHGSSTAIDSEVPSLLCCLDGIEDHAASSSFSEYGTDKVARVMKQKTLSSSKPRREHSLSLHRAAYRTESQRYNHIMAERQRREEMNEKFSILRTILPKLTKKDKASIVTDTINYVKELEKEVKYLQDFKSKAKTKGSKQNHSSVNQEIGQDELGDIKMVNDEYNKDLGTLPHIELQSTGNQALITLVCSRSRGLILRTHKALVECKVDLLQSNVTTLENNAVHNFAVQLKPGVSASNDEIISALEEATRNGR